MAAAGGLEKIRETHGQASKPKKEAETYPCWVALACQDNIPVGKRGNGGNMEFWAVPALRPSQSSWDEMSTGRPSAIPRAGEQTSGTSRAAMH